MLKVVSSSLLEKLEQTEQCRSIRERIINDAFEANAVDYVAACESFNETAEAYFELGFQSALKMVLDAKGQH